MEAHIAVGLSLREEKKQQCLPFYLVLDVKGEIHFLLKRKGPFLRQSTLSGAPSWSRAGCRWTGSTSAGEGQPEAGEPPRLCPGRLRSPPRGQPRAEEQWTASAHMQTFPAHKLEEQLGDTRWPFPGRKLSTLSAGGCGDSLGGRMCRHWVHSSWGPGEKLDFC